MSTKVKGITIELTADTTGIEKALKDVNKELASTQKQLTSVDKSLKLDPSNLELIAQKQQLLAKSAEETAKKLEALKQAQEHLAGQGTGAGNEQYDALSREISDAQVKLTALNKEQQTFGQYAQQAQAQSTTFAQGLKNVGTTADKVAQSTQAMSMAATAALGGLVALSVNAAQQADEWATMSQQLGISTTTLQKFQYASEQIDVGMNDITGAITRMVGSLTTASDVYDRIGVKVKDQNGNLRDTEDIFWDVVEALSNVKNETERDADAMKIFGRNARELSGLIDDGGQKMRELGEEAESLGLIVSEEDIQKLNEYNDLLDGMKAQIQSALVELALPIVEALRPMVAALAEVIRDVAKALSDMNPTVVKIAAVILMIIAAISPLAGLLGRVSFAIYGLTSVIPAAITGLSALNAAFMSFITNPVVATVLAIVAALALIGFAVYEVVTHWDDLKAATSSAMESVGSTVSQGVNSVSNFAKSVGNALSGIPAAFEKMGEGFGSVAGKITALVVKIGTAFSGLGSKAREAGSKMIKSFTQGIESAINSVTNAIHRLASAVSSIWSSMEMDASSAGSRVANNFSNSYNSSVGTLRKPVVQTYTVKGNDRNNTFSSYGSDSLLSAINSLNNTLSKQGATTNVNVELVGSAKNIFDTVRVQNSKMVTATGYHALA